MRPILSFGIAGIASAVLVWQTMAAAGASQNDVSADPSRFACRAACLGGSPTPYCLQVPRDERIASAFRAARARFENPAMERITQRDLMRDFAVTSDPCNRGDTVRGAEGWTNSGAPCRVTATIDMYLDGSQIPVTLEVPDRVRFTLARGGGQISLVPRETATMLVIGDEYLHSDWGGTVREVISTSGATLFQLPRGCIMIPN